MFRLVQVGTSVHWHLSKHSDNRTAGYTLSSLSQTGAGLRAQLNLAGAACDAFGKDIANLTLDVVYESNSRHVY